MLSSKKTKLIFSIIAVSLISCSHYDSIQTNGKESAVGGRSHNAGTDCMTCHHDNSNEASSSGKWWYFAGTAYNADGTVATSGRVELWSDSLAKGTLIYSVPIDREGNFFTSKIFDFKNGVYPKLVSDFGTQYDTIMKPNIVTFANASCNSCHGHNFDGKHQAGVTFR